MHWAVGRQCQCEYGSLPFFWGKGQKWWWWWWGGGGGGVHFCGALAHSIPSLSSWQRAPALLLSLLCRIYQIVASILLRCFIPCTFSCVLNTLWVPSGSLVLSHDSSHSNSLLFSNKSTVPVKWTHSAVYSYRVFGRSVVCSLLVKAPMCTCGHATLLFPTIHQMMSVRIRCSGTTVKGIRYHALRSVTAFLLYPTLCSFGTSECP